MALPTDSHVDLLVCDAVRRSADGKLDIVGCYPTREVKLDAAAKMPVAVNLTFVFVIKDGEGQFKAILRIVDPLGKELHKFEVPEFKKPANIAHVLMLPVGLIPIANGGNYAVSLEIEGQRFSWAVRIFQ